MTDKNLRIKIAADLNGKGITELRSILKATQSDMDKLVQSGGRGSQAFADLKTKAGVLSTTINGLSREFRGLDKDVKLSGMALFELFENATVVTAGVVQGFSKIKETIGEFLDEFNKLNSAKLGLESIAKFKGIDEQATVNSIKNLDLVKSGLLNIGDASLSLKNLLASGFNLDQSIELIKRFGDAAAFGRQSSLEFGYAISSATEGIKNQNSTLVDNAGVTKNLSVILSEAGFSAQDLSKVTTDLKVRTALYNGILKETNGQLGDAAKLTNTFAGQQASLSATVLTIKQRFGELLSQALSPFFNLLKDSNGNFNTTLVILTGTIGVVAQLIPLISALRIAFQGLSISMGWVSVIGIAIAGLIAGFGYLANKVDESAHKIEDLDNRIQTANENVKKYNKSIYDATIILKGYHAELNNTKLSTDDQKAYNEALNQLKGINPILLEQIKARKISESELKAAIMDVARETNNLYQANLQLLESNKNLKIAELKKDYQDVSKEISELTREYEINNKALSSGEMSVAEQEWSSLTNTMVTHTKTVKMTAQDYEDLKFKQDGIISKLGQSRSKLASVISDIVKTHLVGKDVTKDWSNIVSTFAERLRGLGISTSNLINVFRQLGATGVASMFGISGEMLNNAKISQSLAKAWALFTAGKYEDAKNEFLNTLKQASEFKPKTTSIGSDKKGSKTEEEKITSDLSRLQEELTNTEKEFEQLKKELSAQNITWDDNTVAIIQYQKAIQKLKDEIKSLTSSLEDIYKTNTNLKDNINKRTEDQLNKNVYYDKNKKKVGALGISEEDINQAHLSALHTKQQADTENATSKSESIISSDQFQATALMLNSMGDVLRNSLGKAWEDTFGEANSLFEQFMQTVVTTLINNLISKAIGGILNSIFPGLGLVSGSLFGGGAGGAIPGRASGGDVSANKMYMLGERGRELFIPYTNGMILNNHNTDKVIRSQAINKTISQQPTVIEKHYVLEQDGIKFLEKNFPTYKSKKLFRQL